MKLRTKALPQEWPWIAGVLLALAVCTTWVPETRGPVAITVLACLGVEVHQATLAVTRVADNQRKLLEEMADPVWLPLSDLEDSGNDDTEDELSDGYDEPEPHVCLNPHHDWIEQLKDAEEKMEVAEGYILNGDQVSEEVPSALKTTRAALACVRAVRESVQSGEPPAKSRHLKEYFAADGQRFPSVTEYFKPVPPQA